LLQGNQEEYWEDSNDEHDLHWDFLRKFMIFGFSDAASIEHSLRTDGKLYKDVHQKIATAFDNAYEKIGNQAKPVFVIVHSLGAQEVSNYIWDAQNNKRLFSEPGPGDDAMRDFRRFSTCKQFITTGCNIPLFKAGLPDTRILSGLMGISPGTTTLMLTMYLVALSKICRCLLTFTGLRILRSV